MSAIEASQKADDYDNIISNFYTPLKPVPPKGYSLTDAILAAVPSPSLANFLHRERTDIQKLISNERRSLVKAFPPLSLPQLALVEHHWNSQSQQIVSNFSIDISARDLQTLKDGQWLNDNIIDFYLNLIMLKHPAVYCWTTHFFTTLKSRGYQGVARWAKRKKVNVAEKKLVIVPINIMSTHWALAVINNENHTISYFDSLSSNGNLNAVSLLNEYMEKECGRLQVPVPSYQLLPNMNTPQQQNGFDCGVFACTVAKCVAANSPLEV